MYRSSVAGDTPRRCAICVTPMSGLASIALATSMSSSGKFWRATSGAAGASSSSQACLSTLADQTALEFRQRAEHVKNEPPLRGRRIEGFSQAAKPDAPDPQAFDVSINCFIDRARRSSFHTMSVSPLRANSSASYKAGRSVTAPDICSVKIFQ